MHLTLLQPKDAVKPGAPASGPVIGHMNGFPKSAPRPKIFQRKNRIFGRRLFLYLESMHRTIELAILYLGTLVPTASAGGAVAR